MLTEQEIEQYRNDYSVAIDKINAMSDADLDQVIKDDKCPFPSELLKGVPMGMMHCPLCGEMVVAGLAHPKRNPEFSEEELAELAQTAEPQDVK